MSVPNYFCYILKYAVLIANPHWKRVFGSQGAGVYYPDKPKTSLKISLQVRLRRNGSVSYDVYFSKIMPYAFYVAAMFFLLCED
jgi:hypothetical protein